MFRTNETGQATALVWTQSGARSTYPKARLPSLLALRHTNGLVQLSLSGDADRDYVIQTSTDLSHWVDRSTNTIWDGPIADPESAVFPHRFYRVLEP